MHLSGLHVYPVKSARGIALEAAEITDRGILHDRRFMVVDGAGLFVTQRELPQLALLCPAFAGPHLELRMPGLGTEQVPLRPVEGQARRVRVWRDMVDALDLGEPMQRFLTAALGRPASLVYMPDESVRVPALEFARPEDRVGFADGFPYLIATEASLADLNRRLSEPVSMARFRPNLVVAGAAAYEEDTWRTVWIGDVPFEVVKPCGRCVMTTNDPDRGTRSGREPLATLARYRRLGDEVIFGQNALAREPADVGPTDPPGGPSAPGTRHLGTLAVGAPVRVDSTQGPA